MPTSSKARAIGLNHIALEVGDIDDALAFYGRLFKFEQYSVKDNQLSLAQGLVYMAGRPGGLVYNLASTDRQPIAQSGLVRAPYVRTGQPE